MRRKVDLLMEIEDLQRQGTAIEKLSRQLRCYEAAMRLIAKHELWIELAEEIKAIETALKTAQGKQE